MTEVRPELRQRLSVRAIDQAAYELYARAFGQQPNLAAQALSRCFGPSRVRRPIRGTAA
jgi:hypothetical protein